MTWTEERSSAASDEQLDLHGGGRWSAPAQAQPLVVHSLLLRGAAVVLGVLTLAGVGAAASFAKLPSAESLLGGELSLQSHIGSAWIAPLPATDSAAAEPVAVPTVNTPPDVDMGMAETRALHDEQRAPGLTADGKVILNNADVAELTRLPGVGTKRAEAILRLRTRLGRFKRLHDLLRVKGIGARALRKIRDHAVLDAPKPDTES